MMEPELEVIPDDIPLMELAEAVVRGKVALTPQQERMLRELLPFHAPKLGAVMTTALNGKDFASVLERAIRRSAMTPDQLREAKQLRLIEVGKERIETQAVEVEGERR
jgi:hypothetical protein